MQSFKEITTSSGRLGSEKEPGCPCTQLAENKAENYEGKLYFAR